MSSVSNKLPPLPFGNNRAPEPPNRSVLGTITSALRDFRRFYANSMYEGSLKDRLPPSEFCDWKWEQLTPEERATQTFNVFVRECKSDCEWFKTECEFSRLP